MNNNTFEKDKDIVCTIYCRKIFTINTLKLSMKIKISLLFSLNFTLKI